MNTSMQKKLESLTKRHEELGQLLSDPKVIGDQNRFRDYSKEYSELEEVVNCYRKYKSGEEALEQLQSMLEDEDEEMRALAKEELTDAQETLVAIEDEIKVLLLPEDPDDSCGVFLEIRAGTGGDEAALFAGDLFRMYSRFAEQKGWSVEIINASLGDHGGYKEIISRVFGKGVYSQLKFESGAHRVQRVPETESQGRVHTSACTIAVMPEVAEIETVEINPAELKIDTFRSSGAGGQHVNVTDSAIRITHIPTGVVAECQEERSQHKNRAKAMSLLKARILDIEKRKQRQEQDATRRSLVGSGDRSERIRTYNFPQGRVTDHRINLTLYKLAEILEGNLDQVIEPLSREHQAQLLGEISK